MGKFEDLSDETTIYILQYLKSTDIASVSEVNKTIFTPDRISRAIEFSIANLCSLLQCSAPSLLSYGTSQLRPIMLFQYEVKSILTALSSCQPSGRGYWISSGWVSNAKKYYESIIFPEHISPKKTNSRKLQKVRQRRGFDSLPPCQDINAEITCTHNKLSNQKGPLKPRRRLIDSRSWRLLRKFYSSGQEFHYSKSFQCEECDIETKNNSKSTASTLIKYNPMLQPLRLDILPPNLHSLYARRSGLPNEQIYKRPSAVDEVDAFLSSQAAAHDTELNIFNEIQSAIYFDELEEDNENIDAIISSFENLSHSSSRNHVGSFSSSVMLIQPLTPGIYSLVPRKWLKAWRQHLKEPLTSPLPPIDCTCLLCPTHNKLVIPPHLQDFLTGNRKTLLGGLGQYLGLVVEILTSEEWDLLMDFVKCGLPEYTVSFSLDGESVSWSTAVCSFCDPMQYDQRQKRAQGRRNPQSINIDFF